MLAIVLSEVGGIYLGMVGHKTVLESIRDTIQAGQSKCSRQKLILQGRPVYPLEPLLPDYAAYHAVLIAGLALPVVTLPAFQSIACSSVAGLGRRHW